MYRKVTSYAEPREILEKTEEKYCEMSVEDHGFLCGLIKQFLPLKVVEVGIAGGGTTAVVMNCLQKVNPKARMFSVDLNEMCYRRENKKSGYQLEEVQEYLDNYEQHKFFRGKVLPEFIEEIGVDIDFCILDTTHALPGEIFDFLTILPYLRDGAVVVLHDVTLNLTGRSDRSFATKILLDAVSGIKYYNYDMQALNIAAFQVNESTRINIANVFSSLSVTWEYIPNESQMSSYKNSFYKHYDKECLELFELFYAANMERKHIDLVMQDEKNKIRNLSHKHLELFKFATEWLKLSQSGMSIATFFKENKYNKVAVYGASFLGDCLIEELNRNKIEVSYVIDKKVVKDFHDKIVCIPDDELKTVDAIIVTPITFFEEIKDELSERTKMPIISLKDIVYGLKMSTY